jgi:hypothetical protein
LAGDPDELHGRAGQDCVTRPAALPHEATALSS